MSALVLEIKKALPAGSAEHMVLEATAASIPPVICKGGSIPTLTPSHFSL